MAAALAAALRGELAGSRAALARAQENLAQARERIAEREARLRQSPRNSSRPPSSEGLDKELLYVAEENFRHPVTQSLPGLPTGFTPLASQPGGMARHQPTGIPSGVMIRYSFNPQY